MEPKTFKDLSNADFRHLLNSFMEDEQTDLSESAFFTALAAIDAAGPQEVIELTGRIVEGKLILDKHSVVPVKGNEIRLGRQRLIISLEG